MKKLITLSFLIMLATGPVMLLSTEVLSADNPCACCGTNKSCSCCCKGTNKAADTPAPAEGSCTCDAPSNTPQQQVAVFGCTHQYKEPFAPAALHALKIEHAPLQAIIHIALNQRPRSSPLYLLKSALLL